MTDSNLHPVFQEILDSQLSIHSVGGSSSERKIEAGVSVSVCYNRDCFYYDKTDNTCVGNYKACTVKQTER